MGTPRRAGIVRDDLSGVIENDLCIGCGACGIADPTVHISLDPEKQIFEPDSPGGEAAARVCPSVGVDFAELHEEIFPGREVTEFGVVDSVLLAQSTNDARNLAASSGGLVKEILRHLLSSGEVDGAIALDHTDGLGFEARLVTSAEEVDELPGSIYHNLDQTRALELLRENEGRFALVAIPCQLEGIHKYIRECEPELSSRLHTTVGLLCGWQLSHHTLRAMCDYMGADFDSISDVAYRGGGPMGKLRIRTSDGDEYTSSRGADLSYRVAFDRHFNTPRCHLCINHTNFLADIVVGDAWLPSTVFTTTGISLLICRSPHTRLLVDQMCTDGRIVAREVSTEEIRDSQTDRVIFGNFAYAYADLLDSLGIHHPDMVGPNRTRATLAPKEEVEHFRREFERKLELQRARRYRFLRWRKATVELPQLVGRYWTWVTKRSPRARRLRGQGQPVGQRDFDGFR